MRNKEFLIAIYIYIENLFNDLADTLCLFESYYELCYNEM